MEMATSNLPGFDTFLDNCVSNIPCPLTRAISPDLSQSPTEIKVSVPQIESVFYGAPIPVAPGPYPLYSPSSDVFKEYPVSISSPVCFAGLDVWDGSEQTAPVQSRAATPRIKSPANSSSVRSASSCSVVSTDSYLAPMLAPAVSVSTFVGTMKKHTNMTIKGSESLDAILNEVSMSTTHVKIEGAPPKPVPVKRRRKRKSTTEIKEELPEKSRPDQVNIKLEYKEMKLVCYCSVCRLSLLGKHELLQHDVGHVKKSIEVMEHNCPVWLPPIRFLLLNPDGVICTHQQSAICQEIDSFLDHFIDVRQEEKPRLDRYVTRIKEMLPAFPNADPAWYAFRCMETDCLFESNSVVNVALHFLRVHNPFMPYCCLLCGHKAMIMGDMVMHMVHKHFSPGILQEMGIWEDNPMTRQLKLVAKRMASNYLIDGFTNHLKGSVNERRCMLCCQFTSSDFNALLSHLYTHFKHRTTAMPYVCLLCGDPFTSDEDLKVHIFTNHLYDKNFLDAVTVSDNLLSLLFGAETQPKTLVPEIGMTDKVIEYNFWKLQEFTEVPHCSCSLCSFVTIGRVYKKLKVHSLASRLEEDEKVIDIDLITDDSDSCHLIEKNSGDVYTPLIEQWAEEQVLPSMGTDNAELNTTLKSQGYPDSIKGEKPVGTTDVWQVFLESAMPPDGEKTGEEHERSLLKNADEILLSDCNLGDNIVKGPCDMIEEVYDETSVELRVQDTTVGISNSGSPSLADGDINWASLGLDLEDRSGNVTSSSPSTQNPEVTRGSEANLNKDNTLPPPSQGSNLDLFETCPGSVNVTVQSVEVDTPRKTTVTDLLEKIGSTLAFLNHGKSNEKVPSVNVSENAAGKLEVNDAAPNCVKVKREKGDRDGETVDIEVYKSGPNKISPVSDNSAGKHVGSDSFTNHDKVKSENGDIEGEAMETGVSKSCTERGKQNLSARSLNYFDKLQHQTIPDSVDSIDCDTTVKHEKSVTGGNIEGSNSVVSTSMSSAIKDIRPTGATASPEQSQIKLSNHPSITANSPKLSPQSKTVPGVLSNAGVSPAADTAFSSPTNSKISPPSNALTDGTKVSPNSKIVPAVLATLNNSSIKKSSDDLDLPVRKSKRISSHSRKHRPKASEVSKSVQLDETKNSSAIKTEVAKQVKNLVQEYLSEARLRKHAVEGCDRTSERESQVMKEKSISEKNGIQGVEKKCESEKRRWMLRKSTGKKSIRGSFECESEILPKVVKNSKCASAERREAPDRFNDRNVLLDLITTLTKGNLNKERLLRYNLATPKFTAVFEGNDCKLLCDCGCDLESTSEGHGQLLRHISLGSTLYTCGFCRSVSRTVTSIQTHLVESHGYPKAGIINGCRMYHDPMKNLVNQVVDFNPETSDSQPICSQRSPHLTSIPMVVVFLQAGDSSIKKIYCSRCGSPFGTLQQVCQHVVQRDGQVSSVEVLIIMVTQTILTVTPDPKLRMMPVVVLQNLNMHDL